jgi:hypothetical protein
VSRLLVVNSSIADVHEELTADQVSPWIEDRDAVAQEQMRQAAREVERQDAEWAIGDE